MKVLETRYPDIDRKWVAIKNEKNIKDIEKAKDEKLEGEFYLGYTFIDHFSGMSIALIGGVVKNNNFYEPLYLPSETPEKISRINDVFMKESNLEIEIIDKKTIVKSLVNMIEIYIEETFYKEIKKNVLKFRKNPLLDIHRAKHNPDNINILLENKKEDIWCRVVDTKKDEIIAIAINTPREDEKVKRDDLLFLKYDEILKKYCCYKNFKPKKISNNFIEYSIKNKRIKYIYEE